jgi:diguanylate cyclase (GGDEF)-like protein
MPTASGKNILVKSQRILPPVFSLPRRMSIEFDLFRRISLPARFIAPSHTAWFGGLALLLGCGVILGWLLGIPVLTSLNPAWPPMVLNSALCFALAGGALALQAVKDAPALTVLRAALGTAVFLIGAIVCAEIALDVSWIDLNVLHRSAYTNFKHPGQMAPNSAVGFMLVGLLLILADRIRHIAIMRAVQVLTAAVLTIGAVGILSYQVNLDFLTSWDSLKSMALHTALGFVALGWGAWSLWRDTPLNRGPEQDVEARDLYRTSYLLLSVIVVAVMLACFALSEERTEKLIATEMGKTANDRRAFFDTMLKHRIERAQLVSARPEATALLAALRRAPVSADVSERLNAYAASFLPHGFSAIAYWNNGRLLASAGSFVEQPQISLPLADSDATELLWHNGYVLRTRFAARDAEGIAGIVVAEQPLPALTALQAKATREGETGDMAVCGLRDDKQVCFPFRWSAQPAVVPAYLDGKPLPLTRAVRGETATAITLDFRRERVMVAFGPIGATGLGLGVKTDMRELYQPVRRQLLGALPFLVVLVFGSIWVMQQRLRPLAHALDKSRRELAFMARHDGLTGLPNRSMFNDRLEQAMLRTQRSGNPMALMYLDIDNFKNINDSFGHQVGDDVLRWFSQRLRETVRAADTVARLGGDEFTIILENLVDDHDVERIAQNLQNAIITSAPPIPDGGIMRVTTSIGIIYYLGEPLEREELLHRADGALYRSKQQGRNGYTMA